MADQVVSAPITADGDELAQIAYDNLGGNIPGWLPSDGDFATRLLQAFANIVAEWAILAGDVPPEIVEFIGTHMLGVAPIPATSATATSTWTAVDTNGPYTIPTGTRVGLTDPDGNLVAFTVDADVTIPNGSTVTATGAVALTAVTPGTGGNALSGAVTLIDNLSFIASVTLPNPTAGGIDPETTDAYQQRFSPVSQLVAPRPITPTDFELFARAFAPEVYRALAIDGYNATLNTTGNEKCVTVAVINKTGTAISSAGKTNLDALYQSKREVNFLAFVIDPTYTAVDVTFAGVAVAGFDTTDVHDRTITALQTALSPASWGQPPVGDAPSWVDKPIVRFQDIVTVLNNVDGFDHYTSLTIGALKAVTAVAATDVFTSTAHGYSNGDPIAFSSITGGAPIVAGTTYYARDVTANTFKIAATAGGVAIDITTDLTAGFVHAQGTADITLPGPAALPTPAGTISGTIS